MSSSSAADKRTDPSLSENRMGAFSARLRTRFVLLALVVVVPALVVVAYDQSVERQRAHQHADEDLRGVARVAALQQGSAFDGAYRLLLTVAEAPDVLGGDPVKCRNTFARMLRNRPSYTNLWLYDADGRATCSGLPVDVRRIDPHPWWLERTRQTRTATVSDYSISLTTGKPVVIMTAPLLGPSGELEGILAIGVLLDHLDPIVSALPMVPGTTVSLADRNGTILARYPSERSWIGHRHPQVLIEAVRRPSTPTRPIETEGVDGVRRLYAVAPVSIPFETGLHVAVGIEPAAALAEADSLLWRHVWLLAILACLTVACAVAGGHLFVLRPIESLTAVTRRIAEGDFGARAQLAAGAPGLGELVHAVNSMAADLAARDQKQAEAERALRDAEERMRFALASAQVGVWEANLKTGQRYWSEACQAMHGCAPGTFDGTAAGFVRCIHPDDRDHVRSTIEGALRARREVAEFDYRVLWPDGTVRQLRAAGRHVYDAAGAPDRAAGIVMDMTERRTLEEQLRQSQKMDAIGQLAGGIAHDFNNILMAILGNADLALDELSPTDRRRSYLEEIRTAGRDAARLTQQLLAFSRRQVLQPQVMRLGEIIDGITPMLRRLLGETIDLRTEIADHGRIEADAGQMQQVIVNLAVNARDAMPDGGRLTIATADITLDDGYMRHHSRVDPGPYVRLTVSDTGHGMTAAVKERIFEPFFTTKPHGRGTGLGLATVHGVVEQSSGYITVDSRVGHGTTFLLYLPHAVEAPVEAAAVPAKVVPLKGSETILLVEDDAMVRSFVQKALQRLGYLVHVMADSRQAIEFGQAHDGPLHAIVTDVVLTDMNGREMAVHVRQDHPEAKVLFMSGYTDEAIVRHGVLEPGTWFLQKPFTADTLARKLREVLAA
jgi:PAS domain S-box-containing protein